MAEDKKPKATRTVKPVYAIMSVKDMDGNPLSLNKECVEIHSVEKNAEAVLDALEKGTMPAGTFYKRIALS